MSLISPVELVEPTALGAVHFLAIGGSGMSGLAKAYQEAGVPVSGCDKLESKNLDRLRVAGIDARVGHDVSHLDGIDTLVVSSAIRNQNVELVAARSRGLRVWHRSAALAALMLGHIGISVAGAHGKSTTSAMTAEMLTQAGADPSYVIGARLVTSGASAHLGGGKPFVVEADESDGSFLQYPTQIAVITNVEADHLDNWGTPQRYEEGFYTFATGSTVENVVICIDDHGARKLAFKLREDSRKVTTYGFSEDADVRLKELDYDGMNSAVQLSVGSETHRLDLRVPGHHNLLNAAAAFTVGRLLDLPADALIRGIHAFTGTLRRFQFIAECQVPGGVASIYDDYAHHPTELAAALAAARKVNPAGRLVACFQPHLFSRTLDFAKAFGAALAKADVAVITDIYASREDPIPGVSGELIAQATKDAGLDEVYYIEDKNKLPSQLAKLVRAGDLVMTLGAGDVTVVGPILARTLQ